jgi:hypothetical protein
MALCCEGVAEVHSLEWALEVVISTWNLGFNPEGQMLALYIKVGVVVP